MTPPVIIAVVFGGLLYTFIGAALALFRSRGAGRGIWDGAFTAAVWPVLIYLVWMTIVIRCIERMFASTKGR
jgi:hypothetical protein